MTFDDFIKKWTGKGIDFDGAFGDQCMDLMHQYCVEVLGLADGRILAAPAAKDVWLTNPFGKEKFEAIANTPTGVPEKGDIILWGTGIGPYGHVAIFISGNASKFKSFDQNFPTGSKCKTVDHSYTGVLGWLRYKQPAPEIPENLQQMINQLRDERDANWNKYQEELKQKEEVIREKDSFAKEKDELWAAIRKACDALGIPLSTEKMLAEIQKLTDVETEFNKLNEKITALQIELQDAAKEKADVETNLLLATTDRDEIKEELDKEKKNSIKVQEDLKLCQSSSDLVIVGNILGYIIARKKVK